MIRLRREYQQSADGNRAFHAQAPGGLQPGLDAADSWAPPSTPELEFPGCKPIPLSRSDLDNYEGRLEFWDAEAATAWVADPTSPAHEQPSHRLAGLVERIAAVRGSPITCLGSMDLLMRNAEGAAQHIMQADQSVYLRPRSGNLPRGAAAAEFANRLEAVTDPALLAEAGERIIACDTAEGLLSNLRSP